jgi:hypothetical protein
MCSGTADQEKSPIMKRLAFAVALALVPSFGLERASAQLGLPGQEPINPYQRPLVSPYLNMNRSGNPAINYYGLVRPQINTAKSITQLQLQQQALPQLGQPFAPVNDPSAFTLPETGHPTTFFSYGTYFPTTTGGARPGSMPALGGKRR